MNQDTMKGDWKQIKGKVRAKWGKLTDNDLEVIAGEKERLVGKLQELYGHERDHVRKEVDAFYRDVESSDEGRRQDAAHGL